MASGKITPILKPLSYLYGLVQKFHAYLYKRGVLKTNTLPATVICVGNITAGGTGKTPAVIHLTRLLSAHGPITILSRGYKRESKVEPLIVSRGNGAVVDWRQAGDEPYLMAQNTKCPLIVGRKRYISGLLAIREFAPKIILLDDGYQHLNLHRDVNLLIINASNPFGNGYLLPAGILRESLDAIERADIILLSKADCAKDLDVLTGTIKRYNKIAPIFKSAHNPVSLVNYKNGTEHDLEWLKNKKIATFSGIGDPASFRALLVKLGAEVVLEKRYPDHYSYKTADMDNFLKLALSKSADALVTTEKDALRVPVEQLAQISLPVMALKIELKILENIQEWEKIFHDKCLKF